jgi:Protein of unknown function (DUF2924)
VTVTLNERQGGSPRRQLKPGTVLVRLSAIARAITGTAWSGPRFFGASPKARSNFFA